VEVKQNGDYALGVMERKIRNAKSVTGDGDSITIESINTSEEDITIICSADEEERSFFTLMEGESFSNLVNDQVQVEACDSVFSVSPGEVDVSPTTVDIAFTLSQYPSASREEEEVSVDFETSVSLRNY